MDPLDELAVTARDGCEKSEDELWHVVQPLLKRIAVTFGARPQDVPDLIQETMWAAHCHLAAFDPIRGTFRGWIATILIRQLRNQQRTDVRRKRLLDRFREACSLTRVVSSSTRVDAQLTLERLIECLTVRQREVIALYEIAELSAQEVARALNITEAGVRSLARQARNKLAQKASQLEGDDENGGAT